LILGSNEPIIFTHENWVFEDGNIEASFLTAFFFLFSVGRGAQKESSVRALGTKAILSTYDWGFDHIMFS
jgi:hypothetical protein